MPQYQVKSEIIRLGRLADDVFRLTVLAPDIAAAAKPGQFVMVRATAGYDPLLRRPFSIHQAMADGRVQILFKVIGKGTRLLSTLQPGEYVNIIGPLGNAFDLGPGGRICLIGGGMGMAPLFFLARELQRANPPEDILLLIGARNGAELAPLARDFEALGLTPVTATDDGSFGHHGLVIDLIDEHMGRQGAWHVACCGPYPMMRAVAARCKENGWGCQVSLETMMACGVSACLGCAVPGAGLAGKYKHVCKDGPVFQAGEIAWL